MCDECALKDRRIDQLETGLRAIGLVVESVTTQPPVDVHDDAARLGAEHRVTG